MQDLTRPADCPTWLRRAPGTPFDLVQAADQLDTQNRPLS